MIDWATLAGTAAGSVPVINALVALTKSLLPGLQSRYYPATAVAWGILVNIWASLLTGQSEQQLAVAATAGLLAGLTSAKLFEYGKEREVGR